MLSSQISSSSEHKSRVNGDIVPLLEKTGEKKKLLEVPDFIRAQLGWRMEALELCRTCEHVICPDYYKMCTVIVYFRSATCGAA